LGIILHDYKIIAPRDGKNAVHLSRMPIQVNWNDGLGALSDLCFDLRRIDAVDVRLNIYEDWNCTQLADTVGCGNESERGYQHLVTMTNSTGRQGEGERIRSRTYPYTKLPAAVTCDLVLERSHLWSEDEVLGFQDIVNCALDLIPNGMVLRAKI
jgi:hypothetical protein